ncbi:lipid II flippase MurJ [Parapedobacter sp. 2B3]|uniref:lipid II flippase MurJ n=1 Tax=Parapedobacter sp. 2B3 TaxID=3342381 RepID=UPI0035B60ADC
MKFTKISVSLQDFKHLTPKKKLKRKTIILFILRFTKLAFSVVGLSLAAKYFGVSLDRDMWLIALNGIVVVNLAVWGPINETFRAKFIILREEQGEKRVLERVRSLLLVTLMITLLLIGCLFAFRYPIARMLAPAYEQEQIAALVLMLLVVTPSLLFDQFSQLGISILNAYNSFFVPEISNCVAALVNVVSMVLLAPHIGIYALAVSYYIGLVLMLSLVGYEVYLRKVPVFSGSTKIRLGDFKPFFIYALPFFIPYFFIQVNFLVEKALGNMLGEGVVSMLDYSRKFVDIPINVLTSVLLTMLVPVLSSRFAKRDPNGFLNDFKQIYQFGFLIITAFIAFLCSSAHELIGVILYHKEQMSFEAITKISSLANYYAWSALINFFYIIFGLALLATNKGRIYAFFGVLAQFIMIGLNLLFYERFGANTFPLSFIVAHSVSAVALFIYFPYPNRRLLFGVTSKYLIYLALVVAGSYLTTGLIPGDIADVAVLIVNGCIILVVMFALLFILRLEERLFVVQYWQKASDVIKKFRSEG